MTDEDKHKIRAWVDALLVDEKPDVRAWIDALFTERLTAWIQREVDEEEDLIINGTCGPVPPMKTIRVKAKQ